MEPDDVVELIRPLTFALLLTGCLLDPPDICETVDGIFVTRFISFTILNVTDFEILCKSLWSLRTFNSLFETITLMNFAIRSTKDYVNTATVGS